MTWKNWVDLSTGRAVIVADPGEIEDVERRGRKLAPAGRMEIYGSAEQARETAEKYGNAIEYHNRRVDGAT